MNNNEYPKNWNFIALEVKSDAGGKCEKCGKKHDPKKGYTLTVHHIDGNKANCERYNLVALCQRCHLKWQGNNLLGQLHLFKSKTITEKKWEEYQDYAKSKSKNLPDMRKC